MNWVEENIAIFKELLPLAQMKYVPTCSKNMQIWLHTMENEKGEKKTGKTHCHFQNENKINCGNIIWWDSD